MKSRELAGPNGPANKMALKVERETLEVVRTTVASPEFLEKLRSRIERLVRSNPLFEDARIETLPLNETAECPKLLVVVPCEDDEEIKIGLDLSFGMAPK